MSRTAVILALALAAALSVAAAFLLQPPAGQPSPLLLPLDPASISSLSYVDHASRSTRTIAPGSDDRLGLVLTIRNPDGSGFARPLDPTRLAAALRALTSVAHLGPCEPPDPASASTLELTTPAGTTSLRIAPSALAGKLPVRIEHAGAVRSLAAPADAFASLTADPALLLDPAVFRWPSEPVEITIARTPPASSTSSPADTLTFTRTGRLWRLTAPLDAAADRAALGNLQAALSNLRFDSIAAAPSGVAPATAARISVRFAAPDAPADRRADQSLAFNRASPEAFYQGPAGPCSFILREPDLARAFDDAASFIAKQALDKPPGDLMTLLIRKPGDGLAHPTAFRRSADTWTRDDAPLSPADARALASLLDTLASTPAAAVLLTEPAHFEPIASLAAAGLADAPLGELTLGLATPPASAAAGRDRKVLCILRSSIARLYAVEADDPLLAWLRTVAP